MRLPLGGPEAIYERRRGAGENETSRVARSEIDEIVALVSRYVNAYARCVRACNQQKKVGSNRTTCKRRKSKGRVYSSIALIFHFQISTLVKFLRAKNINSAFRTIGSVGVAVFYGNLLFSRRATFVGDVNDECCIRLHFTVSFLSNNLFLLTRAALVSSLLQEYLFFLFNK